jgi:hypothetical protein
MVVVAGAAGSNSSRDGNVLEAAAPMAAAAMAVAATAAEATAAGRVSAMVLVLSGVRLFVHHQLCTVCMGF